MPSTGTVDEGAIIAEAYYQGGELAIKNERFEADDSENRTIVEGPLRAADPTTDCACDGGDTQAVLAALSDDRWKFRTIPGIARDTGLDQTIVNTVIAKNRDQIRSALVPDASGRELYTLRSQRPSLREHLALVQRILAEPFR